MTDPKTRAERFADLLIEHGYAGTCDAAADFFAAYENGLEAAPFRYALMEEDARGINGGPWWNVGDDARALLDASAEQDEPGDWPATLLVDLDSGKEFRPRLTYVLEY